MKLGNLFAFAQLDGIFADQINAADMAVEVDPHGRPVEMGRHLFNMGGFSCAVITLNHHPAIMGKPGKDGQSGVGVKLIGRVNFRHAVAFFGKAFYHHVAVDAEDLAH